MILKSTIAIAAALAAWIAPSQPAPPASDPGVVRGRVVDGVTGRPVGRARVELFAGSTTRSALASPRGEFEFRDVAEESASLRAEKSGYVAAWYPSRKPNSIRMRRLELVRGRTENVVVTMYRKPAIAGAVTDEYGDPMEGVQVQGWRISPYGGPVTVRAWASTNDIGEYRLNNLEPGRYVVAVVPAWSSRRDGYGELPFYGMTFYPAGAALDQAEAIPIGPGQSVRDVNVSLLERAATSVSGTVEDAGGQRLGGGGITAYAILPNTTGQRRMAAGGAQIKPDGTFSLRIPPGEYDFEAYTGGIAQGSGWKYWARAHAAVGPGENAVTLTAAPQSTLTGRVVFDSARKPPAALPRATLMITAPFEGGDECRAANEIDVKPDWTFSQTQVSGRCVLRSTGSDWTIKSIVQGTTDLTDGVVEFRPGRDVTDLQIVLTDRFTELVPEVTDGSAGSTEEYVLLAFPDDPARRPRYLEVSRFVGTFTPSMFDRSPAGDAERAKGLRGLPAGSYRVVALEDLSYDDARDPSFMEALERHTTAVVLAEGERRRIQLRRVTFPPEPPR